MKPTLKEQIVELAQKRANYSTVKVLNQLDYALDKWGDYFYAHFFVPILKAYKDNAMLVRYVRLAEIGGYFFNPQLFTFWFPLVRKVPAFIPPEFSHLGKWADFHDGLVLVLTDHPSWAELKAELVALDKAYHKAKTQCETFVEGVKRILTHYDTLNEAVAAWPSLRFFIPEELRDYEFPFDGQPRPLPEGVNITKLTAMAVCFRLTEE